MANYSILSVPSLTNPHCTNTHESTVAKQLSLLSWVTENQPVEIYPSGKLIAQAELSDAEHFWQNII